MAFMLLKASVSAITQLYLTFSELAVGAQKSSHSIWFDVEVLGHASEAIGARSAQWLAPELKNQAQVIKNYLHNIRYANHNKTAKLSVTLHPQSGVLTLLPFKPHQGLLTLPFKKNRHYAKDPLGKFYINDKRFDALQFEPKLEFFSSSDHGLPEHHPLSSLECPIEDFEIKDNLQKQPTLKLNSELKEWVVTTHPQQISGLDVDEVSVVSDVDSLLDSTQGHSNTQLHSQHKDAQGQAQHQPVDPETKNHGNISSSSGLSIGEISRKCPNNASLAKYLKPTGRAISGHGLLPKNFKYFTLPANIQLNTYRVPGQTLSDRMGIHIEAGHIAYLESPNSKYAKSIFRRTYRPGNLVPNYLIFPPDDKMNAIEGSIMVVEPTFLSEIIKQKSQEARRKGTELSLDLATCQSYHLPSLEGQTRDNLRARLDIVDRELERFHNEYGHPLPTKIINYLAGSVIEIEKDMNQYEAFLTRQFFSITVLNHKKSLTKSLEQLKRKLSDSIFVDWSFERR